MTVEAARDALAAHKAVCTFRVNPSDRRSGSNVCGTCFSLVNQVIVAERRAMAKDEAPCCLATMDEHGRMTPGYCGPDCLRRPRG